MKISLLLGTLWPASTHGKQAQLLRILLKITCRSLPILFQNSILELLFIHKDDSYTQKSILRPKTAFLIKNHHGRAIDEKTKEIQFKDIVVKKDISRIHIIKICIISKIISKIQILNFRILSLPAFPGALKIKVFRIEIKSRGRNLHKIRRKMNFRLENLHFHRFRCDFLRKFFIGIEILQLKFL